MDPDGLRGCIRIERLTVVYGKRRVSQTVALQNLSLDVPGGEFLTVVGTSGCGKSTLLNCLAGFVAPSKGVIEIDGKPVLEAEPEQGMVFQEDALFPWKTVRGNIEFGCRMRALPRKERRRRTGALLRQLALGDIGERYPYELSGGMKQRIEIARALANDPRVLLLDEPFNKLDAQTRLHLQEFLQSIWTEYQKTVVFVTHDIDEAIYLGRQILVLTRSPGRIRDRFDVSIPYPRTADTLTSKPFLELKRTILGIIQSEFREEVRRRL